LQQSPGWRWLKPGASEGTLIGGCLESLQHLRGTAFWPSWDNAILFFETSEERPSPETVDGILMDYENMGVFENLAGMLVGRPMRYLEQDKAALDEVLLERTKRYDFPIVSGMDFGHTAPQLTLPVGCRTRIDTTVEAVVVLDAAVA
jgi:muramoyltetrapeptide carboxypeptidase LdcA involved in peptidoglycan recycling